MSPRYWFWILVIGVALAGPPPAELYLQHCQGCHLADGSGVPGAVPPLSELGQIVTTPAGRRYVLQVPGVVTSSLSDAETAEVLNYIFARFTELNVPPFDAAEVHRYRQSPLIDPGAERRRLLGEP